MCVEYLTYNLDNGKHPISVFPYYCSVVISLGTGSMISVTVHWYGFRFHIATNLEEHIATD